MAAGKSRKLEGVHKVKKPLKDGICEYHYVYRGGPKFWQTGYPFDIDSDEYFAAYDLELHGTKPAVAKPQEGTVAYCIDKYRSSAKYIKLKPRTKEDYDEFLDDLIENFGPDSIGLFELRGSLEDLDDWKAQWIESDRRYDYAGQVLTLFLNWCVPCYILGHFHHRVEKHYSADRAAIVWRPKEFDAILAMACERGRRIVITERETGLSAQDLGALTRDHVEDTLEGRRIVMPRGKTGQIITLPVTPAMAEIIDSTPKGQKFILVSLTGERLTAVRASAIIRELKEKARALDPTSVRENLRLHDMRGTFVTMLLRAGCDLNEIAVCMGWSIRHAANIIERYAKIVPEVTDQIGVKLAGFKRAATAFALERQRQEEIRRPAGACQVTSAPGSTGRAPSPASHARK